MWMRDSLRAGSNYPSVDAFADADSFFHGHGLVHFFLDEGGNFTQSTGWSVVCSLAIPHGEVRRAVSEINHLTHAWPRNKGELKGGSP